MPSLAPCPLFSRLSPLLFSVPSVPFALSTDLYPSTDLCPLYGPRSPLRPSIPSAALCPFYAPSSPLRPSASFTALSLFYGYLSSQQPFVPLRPMFPFATLCPLYRSLPPSTACPLPHHGLVCTSSMAHCPLHSPLSPLRPPVPSTRHVFYSLFHK